MGGGYGALYKAVLPLELLPSPPANRGEAKWDTPPACGQRQMLGPPSSPALGRQILTQPQQPQVGRLRERRW